MRDYSISLLGVAPHPRGWAPSRWRTRAPRSDREAPHIVLEYKPTRTAIAIICDIEISAATRPAHRPRALLAYVRYTGYKLYRNHVHDRNTVCIRGTGGSCRWSSFRVDCRARTFEIEHRRERKYRARSIDVGIATASARARLLGAATCKEMILRLRAPDGACSKELLARKCS